MTARAALLSLASVVLCVPASAAAGSATSGRATAPITIAVEAPLSGPQASNGLDILRGVRLAVSQVNAQGGVLGRPVKILRADDRGEQARARAVARRVIGSAVAVIGPYNSSVGIANLPLYLRGRVVPVHLTSSDATRGAGVTIQPKNSQIAPVERRYVRALGSKKVAMLVDDTPNGAFTLGMATRLRRRLVADGVAVSWIPVKEVGDVPAGYFAAKVAEALAGSPDLIYASTYYPEGAEIARALTAAAPMPRCLMGLGNVDPGFIAAAGLPAARRCAFSGVPAAPQLRSARTFVRRYRALFKKEPGVWGVFAYDSANMLLAAMQRERTTRFNPLIKALRRVRGYRGQTGTISIDPVTGYRTSLPFLGILAVNRAGRFVLSR